jgi:uncharacterized membrane protein
MLRAMLQEREVAVEPAVRMPSVYRDPLTWAIVLVVFGAYTVISVFRLMELNPGSWDLAIFTELVKQYAHFHAPIVDARGTGTNLLGDHFSPALAIFAPFFRIFPSAATLLVGQALLTAVSVFPVAQAAREKVGPGPARAIALAYGFSWGLQQMINFDVHEIAIAVPLLAFALSAVVRGRIMTAFWWALPLVFVKEDQGFTVAAIGVYLLVSGVRTEEVDRVRVRAGEFLLIWGLAWSVLAITVIIPHFNADHVYTYWNLGGALAPGHHASLLTLARQFWYAWPVKLETLVLLLLPTAFLAVRSPLALIAVPSLALRFESSNSAYWGTAWHYNATVMPILFVAAIAGLAGIRAARQAEESAYPEDDGLDGPDGIDAHSGPDGADGLSTRDPVDGLGGDGGAVGAAGGRNELDRSGWAGGRSGWWRATLAGAERHGAAMMLAIAAAMAFQYPLNGLWNGQTYEISPHVAAADAAMAKVPNGATVITTLDLLASLAARTDTFWIGNSGNPKTEYIVYDGKDSGYPPGTSVPGLIAQFYPGHIYTQIFVDDGVYVFHRSTP